MYKALPHKPLALFCAGIFCITLFCVTGVSGNAQAQTIVVDRLSQTQNPPSADLKTPDEAPASEPPPQSLTERYVPAAKDAEPLQLLVDAPPEQNAATASAVAESADVDQRDDSLRNVASGPATRGLSAGRFAITVSNISPAHP